MKGHANKYVHEIGSRFWSYKATKSQEMPTSDYWFMMSWNTHTILKYVRHQSEKEHFLMMSDSHSKQVDITWHPWNKRKGATSSLGILEHDANEVYTKGCFASWKSLLIHDYASWKLLVDDHPLRCFISSYYSYLRFKEKETTWIWSTCFS